MREVEIEGITSLRVDTNFTFECIQVSAIIA